ncbi:MAG: PKD domain-containing protein, partial [Candidatus Hodarchaeota archaeon]
GPASFFWDFGDGTNSTNQNPSHLFNMHGNLTVSLNVTDDDGDWHIEIKTDYILVIDLLPISDFQVNITLIPLNESIQFTFNGTIGDGPATFFWTFGDGSNSTEQNPIHEYVTYGTFTISLTVTDDDGDWHTESKVNLVSVVDLYPVADFTSNVTILPLNDSVQFIFNGSIGDDPASFFWDFGDGSNSTVQDPIHQYTSYGYFTINLTVIDVDGDPDSVAFVDYVTVVDLFPVAAILANESTVVNNERVQFTFTGFEGDDPATYLWDFGDGSNSTVQDPVHQYTAVGIYNVSLLIIDVDGDNDTIEITNYITVIVDIFPVADFTVDKTYVSVGESISFTFKGQFGNDPTTLEWSFGDGSSISNNLNPTHSYITPGLYSIVLTLIDKDGDVVTKVLVNHIRVVKGLGGSSPFSNNPEFSWILTYSLIIGMAGVSLYLGLYLKKANLKNKSGMRNLPNP